MVINATPIVPDIVQDQEKVMDVNFYAQLEKDAMLNVLLLDRLTVTVEKHDFFKR